ncbi:hypothetical protein DVJ78_03955 [Humibacter sp. BT305]|uniref:Uncharacterized protein n=1 Tax=Cnuibacter physcomitrellae TaxID=1619308 RepID=A0A1X9LQL2_9MICO|nr:hypothetical protein [Cnuibacter physcomitrellae]ARJ06732.1 hypothetical protein B5808_17000 [Cnuibacter physcomitrellae]AXH34677.1 hypothetical protein DVJ78_03955 [Humibacter sp. BT305]MCS5497915.1 hypothetical protein [Cnuibacter physcomitrellae]GGI38702.1 hypothetical protein GCM10010988_20340 [Cnuibacter physcomitrellae]
MTEDEIVWNEQAHTKILDDADRVLREAVLSLRDRREEGSDALYAALIGLLENRFIDFEPGPDIRKYADALAAGEIE